MGPAYGLSLEAGEVGVAEIVRQLGVPRSRAYRTLNHMERYGFLRRVGEAEPGPKGGRPAIVWRVA
jgi:DNA-binding IclR family transcriptional regulator